MTYRACVRLHSTSIIFSVVNIFHKGFTMAKKLLVIILVIAMVARLGSAIYIHFLKTH